MTTPPSTPYTLQRFQKRWIADRSRFKLAVKSVQIGWTFTEALAIVLDMLAAPQPWLWMSGSQRQSREAAQYCKRHLAAVGALGQLDENVEEFFGKTKTLVDRVTMPNGSRAFFLPANPDTARGFAGNVVLDEFASHQDARAVWGAMFGRVSRGYSLHVFSSPKGAIGKFWELARQLGLDQGIAPKKQPVQASGWSGHWCDIHMAIADGAPLKADELREAMADDDLFSQEYLCQFLDAESQLISTELIEAAVSARATTKIPPRFVPAGPIWAGTDVGRRRDVTVHTLLEQIGEQFVTRVVDIQRRATFARQKARIEEFLPIVRRHAIDATGLGMQQAEELQEKHPGRCEPVDFGKGDVKSSMALALKRKFEDHQIEIPDDRDLKTDLKAVKRILTDAGNVRYDAKRTESGHADRFWAVALALHASEQLAMPMSDGVLAGRGVVTSGDLDALTLGAPATRDWWHPDHSSDQRPRYGGVL